jgi:hypothetical protein
MIRIEGAKGVSHYRIENGYAPSALETETRGDRFALIN